MRQPAFTPRRWTRAEYDRLIALGAFDGERIELIGGELLVAEPQGAYHASTIGHIHHLFVGILPPGSVVRSQAPARRRVRARARHCGRPRDARRLPQRASSPTGADHRGRRLEPDLRRHKSSLYARGGVEDYWIVSVADRTVEVYRDPGRDPTAPYWWRYRSI